MKTSLSTAILVATAFIAMTAITLPQSAFAVSKINYGEWEAMGKGYMVRSKEVDPESVESLNIASNEQPASSDTTLSAMWIRTAGDGLARIAVSDIAAALGVSEGVVQIYIDSGSLLLTNEGGKVRWHHDADDDSILFPATDYYTLFTDRNAYHLSIRDTNGKNKFIMLETSKEIPSSGSINPAPFQDTARFETELAPMTSMPTTGSGTC